MIFINRRTYVNCSSLSLSLSQTHAHARARKYAVKTFFALNLDLFTPVLSGIFKTHYT